jgi:hypothetical protein
MHYLLDENGRREWTRNLQHDFITLFRDVMREPGESAEDAGVHHQPLLPSTSPRCLPPAATSYSSTQAPPPTPGS